MFGNVGLDYSHTPSSPKVVLINLLLCVAFFYMLIFSISSLCFGFFEFYDLKDLLWTSFGPKHATENEQVKLGSVITICAAYLICSLHWPYFIGERFWDFAITIWLQYLLVGILLRLEVVTWWPWWLANLTALATSILVGEAILFYKRRRRQSSGHQSLD